MTTEYRTVSPRRSARALPKRLRALVALTVFAATLATTLGGGGPASAGNETVIEFTGRGWGHGRGMGQWGAYGYAQQGWTSTQILDHYYGGTTSQPAPVGSVDPAAIRTELLAQSNQPMALYLPAGSFIVMDEAGTELFRHFGQHLRFSANGRGGMQWEYGLSCNGPWTDPIDLPGGRMFRVQDDNPAEDASGLLAVCGGDLRSYSGEMRIVDRGAFAGSKKSGLGTLNVTTIDDYLRGVVPYEVPSSWPAAALQAQAVAARSYALAGDTRQAPYADTCDTTLCQVYAGRFQNGAPKPGSGATDAAVVATAGLVRVNADGSIARTEFSSSTGGYTIAGAFPAVVDAGDADPANPHRSWTIRLSTAGVEAKYGLGRLLSMRVTERHPGDPHGDGGRAKTVEYTFQNGKRTVSGQQVRADFGQQLKSDWFTPGLVYRTDLEGTPTAAFVNRAYTTYVGRAPSPSELAFWYDRIQSDGNRYSLTRDLSKTPEFAGVMIDELYVTALDRAPDPGGSAYWLDVVVGQGVSYASIGVYFYGSAEYYARNGSSSVGYVAALYRDLLGRDPDPDGLAYWVAKLDVERVKLDDVSAGFYASLESRLDRADSLYQRVLGRPADSGGALDAANRIGRSNDLIVAAELGASDEFWARAQG